MELLFPLLYNSSYDTWDRVVAVYHNSFNLHCVFNSILGNSDHKITIVLTKL